MAQAIAGECRVGVGAVFAPGLVEAAQEGFDLVTTCAEEWTEDAAGRSAGSWNGDDGVDAAETLGPGPAKKFKEDGLGLVVHGVGGEDGVGLPRADKGVEEVVAKMTSCLFDGFAGSGSAEGDVDRVAEEGDFQGGAELLDEVEVRVCLRAADPVMDVNGGEPDAERGRVSGIRGVESAKERYGICATGDGDADAFAGPDIGAIEDKGSDG